MQVVTVIYLPRVSFTLRLVPTFLGLAAYLMSVPFCADIGGATAYYSVFGLCLVCGFFCGICQCSVFQMGGLLPRPYIGALMAGQAAGALGINLIRTATLAIWQDDEDPRNSFKSALFMYGLGAFIMVLCSVTQLYLR